MATYHERALEKAGSFSCPEANRVVDDMLAYRQSILDAPTQSYYNTLQNNTIDRIIIELPLDVTPDMLNKQLIKSLMSMFDGAFTATGEIFVHFFVYCMRNGLYNKDEFEVWNDEQVLDKMINSIRSVIILKQILDNDIERYLLYKIKGQKTYNLIPLNGVNDFLHSLLDQMLHEISYTEFYVTHDSTLEFYNKFAESFGNLPLPTDAWGFTPETFRQQILFYSNQPKAKYTIRMVKKLYLYIIREYQGDKTPFTTANNMTERFICSNHVRELVKEDYRVVRLISGLEPYEFDNWLIERDEKYTCTDIIKKGRLYKASFSDVPTEFKYIFKRWFMNSGSALYAKINSFPIIKSFLTYLHDRRSRVIAINQSEISFDEIIGYISPITRNLYDYTSVIKSFLQFLVEADLYPVNPATIKYMPTGDKHEKDKDIVNIPEEHYQKMLEGLSRISKDENTFEINKIAFAVFIIQSLCELRTGSILSLTLEDIKEFSSGQYCITSNTKTSRGHKKSYAITPFLYKVFQRVIAYTAKFRENAPKESRQKLFITYYGNVVTSHSINQIFHKVCDEEGLPYYKLSNVRKTYMTNVARHARQNGRSLSGLEQLFDHKSTTTTLKFYAKFTEEEILLTICNQKAITPLEKVQKHIEPEVVRPNKYKVSNGAGYCKQEHCNIDGLAECFVCKYFVTSLSCYDSFVAKRRKIEKLLGSSDLGDEIKEGYDLIFRILNNYIEAMDELRGEETAHA